jgi:RimJ/RimL family protein N-acetyltransferase
VIETDRLLLRPFHPDERARFAALNADPAVAEFLGGPFERAESDREFDEIAEAVAAGEPAFAAVARRADGALLGMAGLARVDVAGPVHGALEIGWRFFPAFWSRGYATEAARAWLAHGFAALGADEVVAFAAHGNHRSLAVMRRLGLRPDPARDFDLPFLPAGDPHRPHALWAIGRADWRAGAPER